MAIKLMGVEGQKLLEGEKDARTQDFLLITHDAFFIKDAKDYLEFSGSWRRARTRPGSSSDVFPGAGPSSGPPGSW